MAMNLINVMKGEKNIKVANAGGSGKVSIYFKLVEKPSHLLEICS